MGALTSKTAATGLVYALLCAAATWWAEREKLGLATDARPAVVRELVREKRPAEVLFFGSSQTARGIQPAAFEARWRELKGEEIRAVNLASLGSARQISFLTLEDWLENNPAPQTIVVECGMQSDRPEWIHELSTRFMDLRDARRNLRYRPYLFRRSSDMAKEKQRAAQFDPGGVFRALDRFALHLELSVEAAGRGPEDVVRFAFNYVARGGKSVYWMPNEPTMLHVIERHVREAGFYRIEPQWDEGVRGRARVTELAAKRDYEKMVNFRWEDSGQPDPFADEAKFLPTRLYGVLLSELCARRGIRLVFAELPEFRTGPLFPKQIEFHRKLGELFLADRAVFYREENFQDPGHLSVAGAELYSRALAEFLAAPR